MSGPTRTTGFADSAGVIGASFAALCCAGTPLIVSALTALGLSVLRRDAVLWPLMFASLIVGLWGFWRARQLHGSSAPLILAFAGAVALVSGVVFIHGFPAKQVIWSGAAALVVATIWNAIRRGHCVAALRSNDVAH